MKYIKIVTLMIIILVALVVFALWFSNRLGGGVTTTDTASNKIANAAKIDAAVVGDFSVRVVENPEVREVSQMPELMLALPDRDWFSTPTMQVIGYQLGLTSKASVGNIGSQYIWREGNRTLTINPNIGLVEFTTAFNQGSVELSGGSPTLGLARSTIEDFLTAAALPKIFFDLDNLTPVFMAARENSLIDLDDGDTGPLLRVKIPYVVVDVPVILPIDSYVVIDGAGSIHLLSLLLPNIKQTEEMVTLVSWDQSRRQVEQGAGVVISMYQSPTKQLSMTQVVPAYYLSMRDFYAMGTRRILTPIHIFSGEQGAVAVLAN